MRLWQVQGTHILLRLQVMLIGLHARVCVTCDCVYVGICVLQEPIQQHQRPLTPTEACVSNITVNEVQEY